MRTVTLELPEDLAERLESMPEGERNHFAVAAFRDKLGDWEENGYEPDEAEKAEIIEALRESIEDEKAGRVLTMEEANAEFERFRAQRRAEKQANAGR